MKKTLILTLIMLLVPLTHASKLSAYLKKADEKNRAQEQMEVQQDMNFPDFSFRLDKRYTDEQGQRCRDYVFRSRSNPYRHGYFTVCDER